MQVRDVMTRDVHTVGPETSAKYAAEVLAERGSRPCPWSTATTSWSASSRRPISCAIGALDPRLHLRRDEEAENTPALLVRRCHDGRRPRGRGCG